MMNPWMQPRQLVGKGALSLYFIVYCLVRNLVAYAGEDDNRIDRATNLHLADFNQTSNHSCTDEEFLRRVTLDVTGCLPTPSEVQAFADLGFSDKRSRKIDELLASEAYAWRWGNWLTRKMGCDELELKYAMGELGIPAAELAYCWLEWTRSRIAKDEPYDQILESVLTATSREGMSRDEMYAWLKDWRTSSSEEFTDGKFYARRNTNDLYWRRWSVINVPDYAAEDVAARFLGIRLECARCHDHPREIWTQADHSSFSAIFNRIKYAELPFTREEKQALLIKFVTACGVILAIVLLVQRSAMKSRQMWLVVCLQAITWIGVGLVLSLLPSYQHVVIHRLNPTMMSPGIWIKSLLNSMVGPISTYSLAIIAGFIPVMLLLMLLLSRKRRRRNAAQEDENSEAVVGTLCAIKPRWELRIVLSVLLGMYSGVGADVLFVNSQFNAATPDPIAHYCHREILRAIGWGGNATQPREVLVSDDWFPDKSSPALLDGTAVPNQLKSDPRRDLALWIRHGRGSEFAARNIVNQIWGEYFGEPLLETFQHWSESEKGYRSDLLSSLGSEFIEQGWSLKWLHREILNSESYQRSSAVSLQPDLISDLAQAFPVKRLSTQQWICAVDQLTQTKTSFGKMAPQNADPWKVATLRVNEDHFAVQSFQLLGHANDLRDISLESAMFGLVETTIDDKIRHVDGRIQRLLHSDRSDAEILTELFAVAYSRFPAETEIMLALDYVEKSSSRLDGWQDITWAILNSPEFQFIH